MKRIGFFAAFFCLSLNIVTAQIAVSPAIINFFTVFEGTPKTEMVTITNFTSTPFVVTDIDFFHGDAFDIQDTAFTIPPGGNHVVAVTCDPHQNVKYADWMLIKSSSHPYVPNAFTFAFVRYTDPYYDATQDKYNEDLKTELRNIVSTGYVALGYNDARDKLFMNVDNQAFNGQGASQNTLECVYTGYLAVGYANRGDAQTNYNLNTEHTVPQSLFSSNPPMYSDLHHLFVATAAANSERSNNPFGVVSNPTWSQGGSKSNGNIFEPRDQQKGVVARACFYFLTRYQDYGGFICGMEPILRTWHGAFQPDSVAIHRNDLVQVYQQNRNPFVDHPGFVDRIASFCSTNNGNPNPIAWWISDTLNFNSVSNGSAQDGYFAIVNQGTNTLNLSNFSVSGTDFMIMGSPLSAVPKDSIRLIQLFFTPSANNQNYSATLTFNTDDPNAPNVSVQLIGNSFPVSVEQPSVLTGLKVFPQPAHDFVKLSLPEGLTENTHFSIWNLTGQQVSNGEIPAGQIQFGMNLAKFSKGSYFLKLQNGSAVFTQKIMIE